jgi:proteasome lid subunit RPN8/RPN11
MIQFPRRLYDEVVRHAYRGNEEEVCGILGGQYAPDHSVVESVHAAENVADAPETRYYIDPEEQLAITETIEAAGQEIVGFYHSHPAGPSQPSETDADRATWPDRSYVIVALNGYPYVGSWRWRDDEFEQEQVTVGGR